MTVVPLRSTIIHSLKKFAELCFLFYVRRTNVVLTTQMEFELDGDYIHMCSGQLGGNYDGVASFDISVADCSNFGGEPILDLNF